MTSICPLQPKLFCDSRGIHLEHMNIPGKDPHFLYLKFYEPRKICSKTCKNRTKSKIITKTYKCHQHIDFKSYRETDTGKTAEAPAPTYVHCPKCCKDMSYVTTSYCMHEHLQLRAVLHRSIK